MLARRKMREKTLPWDVEWVIGVLTVSFQRIGNPVTGKYARLPTHSIHDSQKVFNENV